MSGRWIAIVNGFGLTLGDSIIGLQALQAALALDAFAGARPIRFRLQPERSPLISELYAIASHVAEVHPQPYHDIGLGAPEKLIDIRDFAFDPAFRSIAMIDYFLQHLGVDPATVPPALKRNAWLKPKARYLPRTDLPDRYVLVCPRAAMAMREMPMHAHRAVLRHLAGRQSGIVLTQGDVSADARIRAVAPARSLGELCALVAGASLIVSTDTAMVHLADAYDIPCVAVFTTHRPEWRARDYPRCRAIDRPADLPPALEFARGPGDVAVAQAAWGSDVGWLNEAIDEAITEFSIV